mgnify:FL=1
MTGRKLLMQKLSWDFVDYGHGWYRKYTNKTRKKWSKIPRRISKKELKESMLEHEENMIIEV